MQSFINFNYKIIKWISNFVFNYLNIKNKKLKLILKLH